MSERRASLIGVWCLALTAVALVPSCSMIDDREPTISDGDEQRPVIPSLQPSPGSGGTSANAAGSGAGGSSAQPSAPNTPAPSAPAPGSAGSGGAASALCPPGNNVPCTTPGNRPGACAQPGQCIELCAANVSRAGACLVQPG